MALCISMDTREAGGPLSFTLRESSSTITRHSEPRHDSKLAARLAEFVETRSPMSQLDCACSMASTGISPPAILTGTAFRTSQDAARRRKRNVQGCECTTDSYPGETASTVFIGGPLYDHHAYIPLLGRDLGCHCQRRPPRDWVGPICSERIQDDSVAKFRAWAESHRLTWRLKEYDRGGLEKGYTVVFSEHAP